MPRRRGLLNVRDHLEHGKLIEEGLAKYGLCPLIQEELAKFFLINRAILKASDRKRATGNRHDPYVSSQSPSC